MATVHDVAAYILEKAGEIDNWILAARFYLERNRDREGVCPDEDGEPTGERYRHLGDYGIWNEYIPVKSAAPLWFQYKLLQDASPNNWVAAFRS